MSKRSKRQRSKKYVEDLLDWGDQILHGEDNLKLPKDKVKVAEPIAIDQLAQI